MENDTKISGFTKLFGPLIIVACVALFIITQGPFSHIKDEERKESDSVPMEIKPKLKNTNIYVV